MNSAIPDEGSDGPHVPKFQRQQESLPAAPADSPYQTSKSQKSPRPRAPADLPTPPPRRFRRTRTALAPSASATRAKHHAQPERSLPPPPRKVHQTCASRRKMPRQSPTRGFPRRKEISRSRSVLP